MRHIYASEYRATPWPAGMNTAAVPVGRYKGRNVYRVPVLIRENNSRQCATTGLRWVSVLARGAADAADYVRDNMAGNRPETEIIAVGPKGGEVHRYIGWHSAIGRELMARGPQQLKLI